MLQQLSIKIECLAISVHDYPSTNLPLATLGLQGNCSVAMTDNLLGNK